VKIETLRNEAMAMGSSMREAYRRHLAGEQFIGIRDIDFTRCKAKDPSELAANSPIMQEMIRKHWYLVHTPPVREEK
jgi:hypothetical protein